MRSLWRLFIVSLCLGVVSLAQAQTYGTYTFPSGATAQYPATWEIRSYDEGGDYLSSEESIVNLFDPDSMQSLHNITSTDFIEVLTQFFPGWDYSEGLTFDSSRVQFATLGTRSIARYDFNDAWGDEAMLVAVRFRDGRVGMVVGLTYGGALDERDDILAIAQSFDLPSGKNTDISGAVSGATRGNAGVVGDNVSTIPASWTEKTFADGSRLSYDPTIWEVNRDTEDALNLSSDTIGVTFYVYYARTLSGLRLDTLEKLAEYDFENIDFADFYDPALATETSFAGFAGQSYTYTVETEDDRYEAFNLYLPLENGSVIRTRVTAITGFDLPDLAPVESVLSTLIPSDEVQEVRPLATAETALTQAHTIDGIDFDLLINLPDSWDVNISEDNLTTFSSDYTTFVPGWFSPAEQAERGIPSGDLVAAMQAFFVPQDETLTFNMANVKVQTVSGQQVARYDYVDTDDVGSYTSTIVATQLSDGWIFLAEFFPRFGSQTPEPQAALNVFLSVKVVIQGK